MTFWVEELVKSGALSPPNPRHVTQHRTNTLKLLQTSIIVNSCVWNPGQNGLWKNWAKEKGCEQKVWDDKSLKKWAVIEQANGAPEWCSCAVGQNQKLIYKNDFSWKSWCFHMTDSCICLGSLCTPAMLPDQITPRTTFVNRLFDVL